MIDEINDNVAACKQIDHDQRLVTLPVYVHHYRQYDGKFAFSISSFDQSKYSSEYVLVGKTELVYLVPEEFDPIAQEVAALRRKKMEVINEFNKRVKEIEEQIGKLTAIEHTPAEF